ncbi:MAG: GNAT family N-acetyltransferase [Syntrophorhabdales bacterium]
MMKVSLAKDVDWEELDRFEDRTLFQTLPWLNFIAETQRAAPVILRLTEEKETVGYFTGFVVRKAGIKILGSPFRGWTTESMGFNLVPGVSRPQALDAVSSYAFSDLGCQHFEIIDPELSPEDFEGESYSVRRSRTFMIDLSKSEAELFASMKRSSCRKSIRKAEKSGVTVAACDPEGFVEDYYAQVQDVFAKQSLKPGYTLERVNALIRHLYPTGNLLLARARSAEGISIAAYIFPAYGKTMYGWGGGSWREHQHLCPNEAVFWFAMRYWKARGMTNFHMGGGGEYKRKYGAVETPVYRVLRAKYPFVVPLRNAGERAWKLKHRVGQYVREKALSLVRPSPQDDGQEDSLRTAEQKGGG